MEQVVYGRMIGAGQANALDFAEFLEREKLDTTLQCCVCFSLLKDREGCKRKPAPHNTF
jgi:hypothetical protein